MTMNKLFLCVVVVKSGDKDATRYEKVGDLQLVQATDEGQAKAICAAQSKDYDWKSGLVEVVARPF